MTNWDLSLDVDSTTHKQPKPSRPAYGPYRNFFKRALDIMLSVAMLPLLVPIIGFLSVLVRRDGGPAIYSQERVGQNGEIFTCWKLRSMVMDADAKLAKLVASDPAIAEEWLIHQKLENDPRITRVGAFLRSTSLDELPQIWNVLVGEMSLIGPRPFMPSQTELYKEAGGKAYFSMKPGITGTWQVFGRSETTFADRVSFDESYYANLSFLTDTNILLHTVRVVLKRTGK